MTGDSPDEGQDRRDLAKPRLLNEVCGGVGCTDARGMQKSSDQHKTNYGDEFVGI